MASPKVAAALKFLRLDFWGFALLLGLLLIFHCVFRYDGDDFLRLLQDDLTASQTPPYGLSTEIPHDECIIAITSAVDMLIRLRGVSNTTRTSKLRSLLAWPVFLDNGFMILLKANDPLALVLLQQYAAALAQLDDWWFLRGIGTRLSQALWTMIDAAWWPYLTGFP